MVMILIFILFLSLLVLEMLIKKQKGIFRRIKLAFLFTIPPQK